MKEKAQAINYLWLLVCHEFSFSKYWFDFSMKTNVYACMQTSITLGNLPNDLGFQESIFPDIKLKAWISDS